MKFLLIPDSFKGTMSSAEICAVVAGSIEKHFPKAEIVSIPVADGGEGSVDSFLSAMGGEKVFVPVQGPYGKPMNGFYGLLEGGKTAVIEMAACAGLPLVEENPNPGKTTTYGVGQLMVDAAKRGCRKLIIGLGGSCTNDFGAGAAAAAGVRFLNREGTEFVPVGESLSQIATIDMANLAQELQQVEIVTMCDIDNPLYGKNGAAAIFGPQKGADAQQVEFLDQQLRCVSEKVKEQLGIDVSTLAGAGAAGGMGGGMVAFFASHLQMGIETVLDTVCFTQLLEGADLVFTGEGKLDHQSLRGKVVIGVARRAKEKGVPVVAMVGDIGDNVEAAYDQGVSSIVSINRVAVPFSEAKKRSKEDLHLTADNFMRTLQALEWKQ